MKAMPKIVPSSVDEREDAHRVGDILEIEKTQRDLHARSIAALAVAILLVLGLAGVSWYGYKTIGSRDAAIGQIPGLQQLAGSLNDRLTATDMKVTSWAADQQSLSDRMGKLESALKSNVKTVRAQAQSAANQVGQRIREEVSQSIHALENRMGNVESAQREQRDQLASAQNEIGSLKEQIAGLQKQHAEQQSRLEDTQADVNGLAEQMTVVNGRVLAHAANLNSLNDQVDREEVPFEVANGTTEQVAPGIYVTVSHTDLGHQRVDGWMQIADEGRIVWIHSLPAQQAMTFVTQSDNRTHQLVFTGVQQHGATGYLLLPHSSRAVVTAN